MFWARNFCILHHNTRVTSMLPLSVGHSPPFNKETAQPLGNRSLTGL